MTSDYFELNTLDTLKVSGEDNAKFLQGQLSCDVKNLKDLQFCNGTACNNKGRIYSAFRLFKLNDDFFLEMYPGLAEPTKVKLDKYIPFYKATIADEAPEYRRYGFLGDEAQTQLQQVFGGLPKDKQSKKAGKDILFALNSTAKMYELWLHPQSPLPPNGLFENLNVSPDLSPWKIQEMLTGTFPFELEDSELFTPQELNYDQLAYIDFEKGCYTGQEIVARMHYRGKNKKKLCLLQAQSSQSSLPNEMSALIDHQNNKVGSIIKAVNQSSTSVLIMASVKQDANMEQLQLPGAQNNPISLLNCF